MRILKLLAIALAGVVVVALVGAVALALLFDADDYKSYATGYVAQRTGRSLAIDDPLELSFFPWLAIETGHVSVGNAAGFGDAPFATVTAVSARVRVVPLLRGRVELGRIDLDGLVLNLARDEQLQVNWQDLAGGPASAAAPRAPAAAAPPGGFEVAGIRIRNGRINWLENRTEPSFTVDDLALETGPIVVATTAAVRSFDARFFVRDGYWPDGLDLAVAWDAARYDRESQALAVDGLAVALGALATRWELTAESLVDAPRLAGSIELSAESLADFARAINLRLAPKIDAAGLGRIEAKARFAMSPAELKLDLTEVAGQAFGANVTGEVALDANELRGKVAVPPFAPAAELYALAASFAPAALDVRALDTLAVSAAIETNLDNGRTTLSNVELEALGGQLSGQLAIVPAASGLRLTGAVKSPGLDAAAIARLVAPYLPDGVDAAQLGAVGIDTRFSVDTDKRTANLAPLAIAAFGGTLSGELAIAPAGAGVHLAGTVKTARLSGPAVAGVLAPYLPAGVDGAAIGAAGIDARFDVDTSRGTASFTPFAVEAFGLNGAGSATITGLGSAARVTGNATLQPFAPRDVLRRFGQPVPATADPSALGRATVESRFSVDAGEGRFEDMTVRLDDSVITGALAVRDFSRPSYAFDLSADRVDVDRYLPPRAAAAQKDERAAGDLAIEAETLRAFAIEGTARVANLKLANLVFQDVGTHLAIGDGKATIDSAQARLYGGTFAGGLYMDATAATPTLALRGRAADIAVKPVIEALAGSSSLRGTGSFDIDLAGRGATITDNLRSAAGTMGFALRDGAIEGFNLGYSLCAAYNLLQRLAAPPEQPDETRFITIESKATVNNGVAQSPELIAHSTFMDVTGGGNLTLANLALEYDLRAKLTQSIGIPRCESMDRLIGGSIPFTIRGELTDPEIRPDFGKLIEEQVKDRLRESLQDRLLDRLRN